MAAWRRVLLAVLCCLFAISLPACAVLQKCGLRGCPGDAELTLAVQAQFANHAELMPPNTIHVQSLDQVVYLTGLVDTEFERRTAAAVAQQVPGVVRVVNAISVLTDVY